MQKFAWLVGILLCLNARAEIYGPTGPTPLVTGNGFGLAVFSLEKKFITKLYAHPYRFEAPDPANEFSEGIETANLVSRLEWMKHARGQASYLDQTHVVEVPSSGGPQYYFMPFGLQHNALVTGSAADHGCLGVDWVSPPSGSANVSDSILVRFSGLKESVLAVPVGPHGNTSLENGCFNGAHAWALLPLEAGEKAESALKAFRAWAGASALPELVHRELAQFERWRVAPSVRFHSANERKLWRQSETVLRMAQSREPNREGRANNGMIVASLPDGMWFVSWVRDMSYATLALIRMGHQAEARAALSAYFQARPVGRMQSEVRGYPYQVSVVRYFGNGQEEPFFTMEGSPNIEYDDWGLVLNVLTEYVERYHDLGFLRSLTWRGASVYEVARDLVVRPLLGNLDPYDTGTIVAADTSAWEEYQPDKKHFVFSSAAAWSGIRGFARVARLVGDDATALHLDNEAAALGRGIHDAFTKQGFLAGTEERNFKNVVDSAALEALNFDIPREPALIRGTIAASDALRVGSGGIRRVRGDTPYEKHEFVFSDFSLARNYLRLGEPHREAALIDRIVNRSAADQFFVPEMYVSEPDKYFPGKIGTPTGSIPMVGYGAGVAIVYLLEREAFSFR